MTIVVAIDPGPTQSACVAWDGERIYEHDLLSNEAMLQHLRLPYGRVRPSLIAIEWISSYGMPVGAEVFDTCRWVGRFEEAASLTLTPIPVEMIPRCDVKLHLCNSARAKDANVRQALLDLIGPRGTKKNPGPTYGITTHCWAALGVAVYAHHKLLSQAAS